MGAFRLHTTCALVLLLVALGHPIAYAGESATSSYYPGFQDILAGIQPPPGTYLKQYFIYYSADISRFAGNSWWLTAALKF